MQNDGSGSTICDIQVTTSDDDSEAYIFIGTSDKESTTYTLDYLLNLVSEAGITHGIKENVLQSVVERKIYSTPVKFAECTPPTDGQDGWYEFFFETNINTKPKILKDGSVDYSEYGDLPTVVEGDKLVVYHPPTEAVDGINVRGGAIIARKGRDLAKLKGKGFSIDKDGIVYTAKFDGKVTYIDERLVVDKELVIDGDVSLTTGNVEFQNDIRIRGNVLSGVKVVSEKGSIVVDGYVEQATLVAKKDIVLKNGMQGNGRGIIDAGGDVKGKFFEQAQVTSQGDVNANAIMNANIDAGQDIIVSGKYGIIIGGSVSATRIISANIIGNMSEVRTNIKAGVEGDLFALLTQCKNSKEESEKELKKILDGIEKIQVLIEKAGRNDLMQQRMMLMRKKIECDTRISECAKREQDIVEKMGKANLAKVVIDKVVYPGTSISINGVKVIVNEENRHVEYARRGSGIIVYNKGE